MLWRARACGWAAVQNVDLDASVAHGHLELHLRAGGIFDGVGQHLAHHAVGGLLDSRRQPQTRRQLAGRDRETACGSGRQKILPPRFGVAVLVVAEEIDEPCHVVQGLATGDADRGQPLAGALIEGGRGQSSSARLNDDDREMMGDDVVQLPGDARALTTYRELRERVLFLGELARGRGEAVDQTVALTDLMTDPERHQREERDLDVREVGEADRDLAGGDQRQHRGRAVTQ